MFSGILSPFVTPQDVRQEGKHCTGGLGTLVHGGGFSRLQRKPSVRLPFLRLTNIIAELQTHFMRLERLPAQGRVG